MAFEAFYVRTYRDALRLATLMVRDDGHAADVVQEVFADAFAQWSRISAYERPDLWIRRLVVNRAVSRWRRRRSEGVANARVGARSAGLGTSSHDVAVGAGVGSELGAWRFVARLPRREAQALALVYGADLSLDDAAEVMRCSTGSVKTHLSRGRAALAVLLDQTWEDER